MPRVPESNYGLTLIRHGDVFSPRVLGKKDLLVAAGQIVAVSEPSQIACSGLDVEVVDASDKLVIPGLVDGHVHILGGGGEGGAATRAPEITREQILTSGVSTVIGCLGTDCMTRHVESLLAKANGLQAQGIDAYILTGGWGVPPVTLTGTVQSDLVFIDKVIGAGEVAISDHRSTQPRLEDLARLAADCRLGGLLTGKAGILHFHVGTGRRKLEMLRHLIQQEDIPPTQIVPTHINYTPDLLEDSLAFIEAGGRVDLNAFEDPTSESIGLSIASAVRFYMERNVSLDQISVSSDANGTLTVFDERGEVAGLALASQRSLLRNLQHLVQNEVLDLESAIRLFSTNPATLYKLRGKGALAVGKDADILLLDRHYAITDLFVKGRRVVADGTLRTPPTFS